MTFDKHKFEITLINFLVLLAFFRATNIGLGYPSAEFLLGYANFLPQKIIQIVLLFCLIFYFYLYFNRVAYLKLINPIYIAIAFSVIFSVVFSEHFILSVRYMLLMVVLLLPLVLARNIIGIDSLRVKTLYLSAFILILSTVYILILPQYGIMTANHSGAFRGLFLHKNGFGFFAVLASLFFLNEVFSKYGRFKKAFFLLYFLSFFLVVMSHSTTSLLIFLLASLSYFVLGGLLSISNIQLRMITFYSFIFMILIFISFLSIFFDDIAYYLGKDPTLTGRTELWEVLFYVGIERPLFGHGIGLFSRPEIMHDFSSDFGWEAKSAHSSYLDLFLGIGIIGTVCFIFKLIMSIVTFPFTINYSSSRVLGVTGVITCACFGLTESGAFLGTGFAWLFLVVFIFLSEN